MGDFNCQPDSAPIRALERGAGEAGVPLKDAWKIANPDEEANATWTSWQVTTRGRRIDLILVSASTDLLSATIDRPLIDGRPISDHWPVRAQFALKERDDDASHTVAP